MKFIQIVSYPLALLYGLGIYIRNKCFNLGILRSTEFEIGTISVGNLTTGGTGKTPHIEYLVKLLRKEVGMATLSRGYKRTTSGFREGEVGNNYLEIGDEPVQLKNKFPQLTVAVDEDRRRGIRKLLENMPSLDLVLLDDAHQHRKVKPGLSILLTDYNNLYTQDHLLPTGNLREGRSGADRADIIVVTKCPEKLTPIQRKIIFKELGHKTYQKVYFSYVSYNRILPAFVEKKGDLELKPNMTVLLVTGIARPENLLAYVQGFDCHVEHLVFRDHHAFSLADIRKIRKIFDNIAAENKIILTTEKDIMRLRLPGLQPELESLPVYYSEIEVQFFEEDQQAFDEHVLDYARENKRNRQLYSKQGK